MSEEDKRTCYFKGKGYTGHEDYSCPFVGDCDRDDCFILTAAVKKSIENVIGQIQGKKESEIENQEGTQDPEESVVFEFVYDKHDKKVF